MIDMLTTCKACGAEIAKDAKACPHCGSPNKKPLYKKVWFWVVVLLVIGSIRSCTNEVVSTRSEPKAPAKVTQSKESNMTMGQKNALASAKSYLKFSAFSYTGLVNQLEYEGYTTEEATYAVDNCGADWYEQAAKCAESYLKYSSFSRDGLIDQLEYEGFTSAQALYGVKENGY